MAWDWRQVLLAAKFNAKIGLRGTEYCISIEG